MLDAEKAGESGWGSDKTCGVGGPGEGIKGGSGFKAFFPAETDHLIFGGGAGGPPDGASGAHGLMAVRTRWARRDRNSGVSGRGIVSS